jgi:predicted ribosomally synthesized peptide with SipW-like signal peptide
MKNKIIISSILTIAMCLSLIAGSTFALFTSESKVNVAVTSGEVKVVATAGAVTYGSTLGSTLGSVNATGSDITLTNILPGDFVDFNINVVNESTVTVKYRTVVTISGDKELTDALVVSFGGKTAADASSDWSTLAVGEGNATVAVHISLPETTGNECQNKTCNITYKVEAIQGNGIPDYTLVSNTDELEVALANGGHIKFTGSMDLTDPADGKTFVTTNDDVHFYLPDDAVLNFGEVTGINGTGTLTIHGGTLKTNHELYVTGDATLIIDGGVHNLSAFSAVGNGTIIVNGGTLNCYGIYGSTGGGINLAENGQLIINGGTLNMYQPINLNANRCDNAYVEINGGTIKLLESADKLFSVRNVMEKDAQGTSRGSSIKITGGTIIATYPVDDTNDANAFIRNEDGTPDTSRVLVSNTEDNYNCVVTGGTFFGDWRRTGERAGYPADHCEMNTITGFVADGYEITGDPVNGYVVAPKN